MNTGAKYARQKTIAIDVDGTLIINGRINKRLVEWCKAQKVGGFYMILWSSAGREHATEAAAKSGLTDVFDTVISKPGYIVDDVGWKWTRYTQVVDFNRV